MIFADSYQTTMGSVTDTRPIVSAIRESIIADGIDKFTLGVSPMGNIHPVFITGFFDSEEKIRLFTHPISVFNFKDKDYLCTDLRLFVKKGTHPGDIISGVRNHTEFDFAKSRAMINMRWLAGGYGAIRNSLGFAANVYSTWLAQVIARAFALDYKDQTVVMLVTFAFYRSLFENEFEFSEDNIQALALNAATAMKIPTELCFEVLEKLEPMKDVHDMCAQISKNLENLRPERFNPAVLLNLIANNWYGQGAKEILSVSLEHPPTWVSIVYTALKQRTYKNSTIYQVAERIGKRGASDTFLMSFNNMVKEQLVMEAFNPPIVIPDFD